ncbi:hypothetical protein M8J76_009444 [Diaphorina citri]|nr:hypothetical protein M8J76_009444 [Diaphorina citri]
MKSSLTHIYKPLIEAHFHDPLAAEVDSSDGPTSGCKLAAHLFIQPSSYRSIALEKKAGRPDIPGELKEDMTFADLDRQYQESLARLAKVKEEMTRSKLSPRRHTASSRKSAEDFGTLDPKSLPNVKSSLLQSVTNIEELLDWFIKNKKLPPKLELPEQAVLNSTTIDVGALVSDTELITQLRRLCVQWTNELVHALTSLANKNRIVVNSVTIDIGALVSDTELITQLRRLCVQWTNELVHALTSLANKEMSWSSPSAELVYWKDQEDTLRSLFDASSDRRIVNALKLLKRAEKQKAAEYLAAHARLTVQLKAALANVKILAVLDKEEHNFLDILRMLPHMFTYLRLVWSSSPHYGDEKHMVPLLQKVKNRLYEKSKRALDKKVLFAKDSNPKAMKCHVDNIIAVLATWKNVRWEFNVTLLFYETDYLHSVASDISDILTIIHEFSRIFSKHLKLFVIEDAKVDEMLGRVTEDQFHKGLEDVEAASLIYLNEIFERLRASEKCLQLLQRLHRVQARPRIGEALGDKYELIMSKFLKEVIWVDQEFTKNWKNPPLVKGQTRKAGSVYWVRHLASKLKRTVLLFQQVPELMCLESKEEAFAEYRTVVKQLETFEQVTYHDWLHKVFPIIETNLNSSIFKIVPLKSLKDGKGHIVRPLLGDSEMVDDVIMDEEEKEEYEDQGVQEGVRGSIEDTYIPIKFLTRLKRKHAARLRGPAREDVKVTEAALAAAGLAERRLTFQVNFDYAAMFDITYEGEAFKRMGFDLPESVKDLLDKKLELRVNLPQLESIVDKYRTLMTNLDPDMYLILKRQVFKLETCILPGTSNYNWSYTKLDHFLAKCNKTLDLFRALFDQVKKIENLLDLKIQQIAQVNLFDLGEKRPSTDKPCSAAPSVDPPDCSGANKTPFLDFVRKMEHRRNLEMEKILYIVDRMSPALRKIEEMVFGTNTGRRKEMLCYYERYELRLHECFLALISSNLECFTGLLEGNTALFQIQALLMKHSPLFKIIPRWMSGTCIRCPRVELENDSGKYHQYSYYEDLSTAPVIQNKLLRINDVTNNLCEALYKYIMTWNRYSKLWLYDKLKVCEQFSSKPNVSLYQFEEKMNFYSDIVAEIGKMMSERCYMDVYCVRIDLAAIGAQITALATEWKDAIADNLIANTRQMIAEYRKTLEEIKLALKVVVFDAESFKNALQVIQKVKNMVLDTDLITYEIINRNNTLKKHDSPVMQDELDDLTAFWKQIHTEAKIKQLKILPYRDTFAEISQGLIDDFLDRINQFVERFYSEGPYSVEDDLSLGSTMMGEYRTQFDDFNQEKTDKLLAEELFDLPVSNYKPYEEAYRVFERLEQIYRVYNSLQEQIQRWGATLWSNLEPRVLLQGVEDELKTVKRWSSDIREMPQCKALEKYLKDFKKSVALFVELKHEALRERHWTELMKKTGKSFDMSPDVFTLNQVFAMNLSDHEDECMEIIGSAIKELNIETAIQDITTAWTQEMVLPTIPHTKKGEDRGFQLGDLSEMLLQLEDSCMNLQSMAGSAYMGPFLPKGEDRGFQLGDLSEMLLQLEDSCMNLQSMAGSAYIGPFLPVVQEWEKRLSVVSEVLYTWIQLQRKWLYLEGIFVGGDIRLQLPQEAQKFDDINEDFLQIMWETHKNPRVIEQCLVPNRLEHLEQLKDGLEACEKSLQDYLTDKRNAFPRFFFISDDELLSILGSSSPTAIQEHIVKMFDNVQSLKMADSESPGVKTISAMISCENEVMDFRTPQLTFGEIEQWMTRVLDEMMTANRYWTKKAIYDFGKTSKPRTEWMLDNIGMTVLAANGVWWTAEVENVFSKIRAGNDRAMKDYLGAQNAQLDALVVKVRGELTKNDRKKFNTVLIVDVHARDIIDNFVRDGIMDAEEFQWESQLRYYWKKSYLDWKDSLVIIQCSGSFEYGYEYMGLNGRLVITPLTDRIYLTITQALSMRLGAAPAGPAGTGKTETTKDLAKALGLLCVVTNCGEGMDFLAFGKILSGLSQCGAWGCFDEFNRIDVSVLSVISTQLLTIRTALLINATRFQFEGHDIIMNNKVGIFITMNPGYAGRTELPESVKALFRPVVCIVPDFELICQIMLFSEGFLEAKVLAKKMAVLYKLSKEQLSKQCHYDFGMRALKSVLVMAGELKRAALQLEESVVLMRALRDMNLPKFVSEDVPLFLGLIKDLFPKTDCSRVSYPEFTAALETVLKQDNYEMVPVQVDKVVQMYETMLTRHSTMIVGPTGGGKSVVINALVKTSTVLGYPARTYTLNPKVGYPARTYTLNPEAVSVIELYGVLNPETRDWYDGLLSNIFRAVNKPLDPGSKERKYILFDGDVDALWIENMNSVMDDNKILTLANGERIRLLAHCQLLFEVGDLQYASPATVSRAGMVYVDPINLGYQPYWTRWVNLNVKADEELRELLNGIFDKYIPSSLTLIHEGSLPGQETGGEGTPPLKTIIPQTPLNMIVQLCQMLQASLDEANLGSMSPEELEAVFIQSVYASLGASLVAEAQTVFDAHVKNLTGFLNVVDSDDRLANYTQIPTAESSWYHYTLDRSKNAWVPWRHLVRSYVHDGDKSFGDILVPTTDSTKLTWILSLMNEIKRPCIVVGDTGTSKTATMMNFLRSLSPDKYVQLLVNFSSRTTSMDVQRNIESVVEKRTKDVFGPPPDKKLILFIDDLNMPQVDTYGTQQPIAFLKLLFEKGGMYGRDKDLSWKNIKDTSYFCAMGSPGGGRNHVDPRFISLFCVFNLIFPADATVLRIFTAILSGHTAQFEPAIRDCVPVLVQMTLDLYKLVIAELPPTPAKFHYIFNLRDLSRIIQGLTATEKIIFNTKEMFVRAWRNEFTRTICDRLNTDEDLSLMSGHIADSVKRNFPQDVNVVMRDPLLFGDFRNALKETEPRYYEDLLDYSAVGHLFTEILEEYNESAGAKARLDLVLFEDAREHLTRIHRALRLSRGHCMVVGVEGGGKRSLVRLASFAAGYQVFTIQLSRGYNEASFKEDLKSLYNLLGVKNQATVFLFTAAEIVEEGFLELINNMLTLGMVAALFDDEEKDGIISAVRNTAKEKGYVTKDAIWNFFVQTCVSNLHIVACMSPTSPTLRTRCRNFPGLVNNTCVNWLHPWSQPALLAVATKFIEPVTSIPESVKSAVISHLVHTHESVNG